MLAYVGPEPANVAATLGDDVLASFAALSRVHADGWGAGWRTGSGIAARRGTGRPATRHDLARAVRMPTTAALLYLRFG
ncbi:hypothetical protein AB0198_26990, partial [Klebsiella pneumoniae]